MSSENPETPRNLQQQRRLAKELLKAVRAGDSEAIARLKKVQPDFSAFKLADAQLTLAREAGFDSWPKWVEQLEKIELHAFRAAIYTADAPRLRRLLSASSRLRKKVNSPLFDFGQRPVNAAAGHLAVLDVLLAFGADINLRSDWEKGPFSVLDACPEPIARQLIARGAILTAHAAARFGWLDELRRIVEANPQVVDEKGGDGQRPLHFALTVEIADYLLDHGAQIDARCVDHDSTAAQYALRDRPLITSHLLKRGATPDVFMAARLGDRPLAQRLIDADDTCLSARTNLPGYAPVAPFGIYNWVLGFYVSPHEVAVNFKQQEMHDLLFRRSSPNIQFLDSVMRGDAVAAREKLAKDPSLINLLTPADHSLFAHAAINNRSEAFQLMLELGFDPTARGQDGGTVLHMAAWVGNVGMIRQLIARGVDIHALDPTHGSSPVSWAVYGSVHRKCPTGDYAQSIKELVAAGADIKARGNKYGSTMMGMAEGNPRIQELLASLGASRSSAG